MDTQVKIDRIDVYSKGDESVGIFPATWTVEPEIYVEKEDLETFRRSLQVAWEYVADEDKSSRFCRCGKYLTDDVHLRQLKH